MAQENKNKDKDKNKDKNKDKHGVGAGGQADGTMAEGDDWLAADDNEFGDSEEADYVNDAS